MRFLPLSFSTYEVGLIRLIALFKRLYLASQVWVIFNRTNQIHGRLACRP